MAKRSLKTTIIAGRRTPTDSTEDADIAEGQLLPEIIAILEKEANYEY